MKYTALVLALIVGIELFIFFGKIDIPIQFETRVLSSQTENITKDSAEKEIRQALHQEEADLTSIFTKNYDLLGSQKILDIMEEELPVCHGEAHRLGEVIYDKTGDYNIAYEKCGDRCSTGCMHGIINRAFAQESRRVISGGKILDLTNLKSKISEFCSQEDPYEKSNCIHGVGHAMVFITNYNIEESIKGCGLIDDIFHEYDCVAGVFMEFNPTASHPKQLASQLHYPCDTFREFPSACYRYKAWQIISFLGGVDNAANECTTLEDKRQRWGCFHGLGTEQFEEVYNNPQAILEVCRYGEFNDKRECVAGAIERISYHHRDEDVDLQACEFLQGELKDFCKEVASYRNVTLEHSYDFYFGESI